MPGQIRLPQIILIPNQTKQLVLVNSKDSPIGISNQYLSKLIREWWIMEVIEYPLVMKIIWLSNHCIKFLYTLLIIWKVNNKLKEIGTIKWPSRRTIPLIYATLVYLLKLWTIAKPNSRSKKTLWSQSSSRSLILTSSLLPESRNNSTWGPGVREVHAIEEFLEMALSGR